MKLAAVVGCLAVCLAATALPVLAHEGAAEGAPRIVLLSRDPVVAGDYTMDLRIENFTLLASGDDVDEDSGHIFYALNKAGEMWLPCSGTCSEGTPYETVNTTFTFHDLKVGDVIAAVLVRVDGSSLATPVLLTRTVVNVGQPGTGPDVRIDGTLPNPLTPNPGDYTVHILVAGIDLLRPGSGQPNDRLHGHLLYTLNGQPCMAGCGAGQDPETTETTFTFHGVKLRDVVGVQLVNNDGRPWDPAIGQRLTVAAPALQILSVQPRAGDADLTVKAISFTLVKPTSPPRSNNAGAGHIHYLIKHKDDADFQHAPGSYATAGTTFHYTDLQEGDVVAAELVNNDHSSLDPPVRVSYEVLGSDNQDPFAPGVGPILVFVLLGAALVARRLRE